MKKFFLLFVFAALCKSTSMAQDDRQPDVITPSPEAASLGKFAQIPVSYNTGSPQVEIPLYEINVNDMKVPIGLSCHTAGIKVEEVASWVGLGFTLNAGGAITRVMQGRPDESSFGYFNEVQWAKWQNMKNVTLPSLDPSSGSQAAERYYFQKGVSEGQIDLQPDIFYFNFAGYTGRIVFDVHKTPVIIPHQDLKISHPFSESSDWVISTPEGIEYIFRDSDAERTTPRDEGIYIAPFVSTWYLSEVRSNKQPGFITFTYESIFLAGIEMRPAQGVILPKLTDPLDKKYWYDPIQDFPEGMSTSEYSIDAKYLRRIQFTNGSIDFNSTQDRLDKYYKVNYNGRKLNSLIVFGPGFSVVKQVDFTYMNPYPSDRLTLESVKETGKAPYRFTYQGHLPPADSYAQDHWGYYNGKVSNRSLIPAMNLSEQAFYRASSTYLALGGADRDPTADCVAGTISSITYPTGGKRVFSFEENKITTSKDMPFTYEIHADGDDRDPSMNSYAQGLYNWYYDIQADFGEGQDINVDAMTFTIDQEQYVELAAYMRADGPGAIPNIAEVFVYKESFSYDDPEYYNRNGIVYLQPGTYIMIAACSNPGVHVVGTVTLTKTVFTAVSQGGMRIAEINDYDGEKLIQSQAFKYIEGEVASSGLVSTNSATVGTQAIVIPPDFPPPTEPPVQQPIPPSSGEIFVPVLYRKHTPGQRLILSSSNLSRPNTFEGYHIGYRRVEVIQRAFTSGTAANGEIIYIYDNNVNDIMRGLLRDVAYLNSSGDMVRHTHYTYNYDDGTGDVIFFSYAPSIEMEKKSRIFQGCQIGGGPNGSEPCSTVNYFEFDVKDKTYTTFFPYQTKIVEKVFSKDHYPEYLVTTTEIKQGKEVPGSYEDSHTFSTEIIKTTSTTDKIVERFTYSPGLAPAGVVNTKVPIRHVVLKENNGQLELLKATATDYQGDLPRRVKYYQPVTPVSYSLDADIPYDKTVENAYANQKLVSRYATDGVRTAYLWDVAKVNPIAEIVNCTSYTQAAYTGFEGESNEGNWSFVLKNGGPGKAGDHCYSFIEGATISKTLTSTVSYRVTCWAKNGVPVITNVQQSHDDSVAGEDGWKFYDKVVLGSSITISAEAGTLIDEVRIHPVNASMVSITYRTGVGITSKSDPNGKITYYEYDDAGRLILIRDHQKKRVQNFDYHYKGETN